MNRIMKTAMRTANSVHVGLYRASKGRIAGLAKNMPILLLTVPGRNSGVPHTTPVVYLKTGEIWIVSGSAGGMPAEPQWFRNLRNADRATIEVGATRTDVLVTVADAEQREGLWRQLLAVAPFFEDYQKKVDRVIPVAVLTPSH